LKASPSSNAPVAAWQQMALHGQHTYAACSFIIFPGRVNQMPPRGLSSTQLLGMAHAACQPQSALELLHFSITAAAALQLV